MENKEKKNVTMVLYTDGSASGAEAGLLGMGYHGYYFENDVIKKTTDVPTAGFPSKEGYIGPDNESEFILQNTDHLKVTPLGYLDGYVASDEYLGFSIGAEMYASEFGIASTVDYFKNSKDYNLTKIQVHTDSLYAITVFQRAMKHLKEDPTMKDNHSKIAEFYKKETTQMFMHRALNFVDKIQHDIPGLVLEFVKVRGHTGNIGNELADKLAGLARKLCLESGDEVKLSNWTNDRYWKPNVQRHPFLRYSELFFMHNVEPIDLEHNLGYFTIMNYKGSNKIGSRTAEPIFGIVKISNVPSILKDLVYHYQEKYRDSPILIYAVDMDKLYRPEYQSFLDGFGIGSFLGNDKNQLKILNQDTVVYPVYPPGMGRKVYDNTQQMANILDQALLDIESGVLDYGNRFYVDVTDKIYKEEGEGKKKKVTTILANGQDIKLKVKLNNQDIDISIIPNIDIIDRNHLKAMEKDDTKVYILFSRQGELCYDYYSIVINKKLNSSGIYHNLFSSRVILEDKKK